MLDVVARYPSTFAIDNPVPPTTLGMLNDLYYVSSLESQTCSVVFAIPIVDRADEGSGWYWLNIAFRHRDNELKLVRTFEKC